MSQIIITNAHIFRGQKDQPWASNILLEKTALSGVNVSLEDYKDAEVFDLEGKYLIPDVSGAIDFLEIDEDTDMEENLEILRKKTVKSLIGDVCKNPLEVGQTANYAVYQTNPVAAIGAVHFPDVDMIIKDGEVVYDVEEYNRNMLYTMVCTSQF